PIHSVACLRSGTGIRRLAARARTSKGNKAMTVIAGAIIAAIASFFVSIIGAAVLLRRVVPTNEVHIVQTSKKTTSYGKDQDSGNTYYKWPSWLPMMGLSVTVMPVSVFSVRLDEYEAYDKDRVPFLVDVVSFFRISDSNTAAQRVATFRSEEHTS